MNGTIRSFPPTMQKFHPQMTQMFRLTAERTPMLDPVLSDRNDPMIRQTPLSWRYLCHLCHLWKKQGAVERME